MLATLMIPATVLIVPQYMTVADLPILHLNLIGSPAAIWLPSVANAFNIFLLKRFFDSIPAGADSTPRPSTARRALAILRRIVLPISRPILGVVSIFGGGRGLEGLPVAAAGRGGYSPSRETLNVGICAGGPDRAAERGHRRVGHRRRAHAACSS